MSYFFMKYLRNKDGLDLFHSYSPVIEKENSIKNCKIKTKFTIMRNYIERNDYDYLRKRFQNYHFPHSSDSSEKAYPFQHSNSLYSLIKECSREQKKHTTPIHHINIQRIKFSNLRLNKMKKQNSSNFTFLQKNEFEKEKEKEVPLNYFKSRIIKKRESILGININKDKDKIKIKNENENVDDGDYHPIFNNMIIKNKIKNSLHQYDFTKSVDLSSDIKMNLKLNKCINKIRMDKILFKSDKTKIIPSNDPVLNYKKDYVFNITKNMRNASIHPFSFKRGNLNPFHFHKSLTMPLNHDKNLLGNDYNHEMKMQKL